MMKKVSLFLIILLPQTLIVACNKTKIKTINFSVTGNTNALEYYDIYPEMITDFIRLNSSEEMYEFLIDDKFELSHKFDQEIANLEENNFFRTNALICLVFQTGTGDTIDINSIEGSSLTLKYTITRGIEEGLAIKFIFIEVSKLYLDGFNSIEYEIDIIQ